MERGINNSEELNVRIVDVIEGQGIFKYVFFYSFLSEFSIITFVNSRIVLYVNILYMYVKCSITQTFNVLFTNYDIWRLKHTSEANKMRRDRAGDWSLHVHTWIGMPYEPYPNVRLEYFPEARLV